MKILEICVMPTCINVDDFELSAKIHESLLRSYHILGKAKELLVLGVPSGVVLDLIAEMETAGSDGNT